MITDAVRALLVADSTLQSILNGKIYPIRVPQGKDPPCVACLIASNRPNHCKNGTERLDQLSFTVLIFSLKYSELSTISERIRTVLDGYEGVSEGKEIGILFQDQYEQLDEDSKLFLNQMEFEVTYKT